jgi:hypothetical protein
VKNAANSSAPASADHAAQNLRTNSMGLSIWLLLWSMTDTIPAPPIAYKKSRREGECDIWLLTLWEA